MPRIVSYNFFIFQENNFSSWNEATKNTSKQASYEGIRTRKNTKIKRKENMSTSSLEENEKKVKILLFVICIVANIAAK